MLNSFETVRIQNDGYDIHFTTNFNLIYNIN